MPSNAAPVAERRRLLRPPPVAQAVERTPADRDRVVDAARAVALCLVVVGHGVMAVVAWPDGVPVLGNLLAAYPWTQALTWLLQIMPLFFWASGAANALSWTSARHGARMTADGYAGWLWRRGQRLLRPVWVYLAVMSLVAAAVTVLAPRDTAAPLMALTCQLLWFLGCLLLVTALMPAMTASTLRGTVLSCLALVALTAVVDVARFTGGAPEAIGLVNFVAVWCIPALLGVARARGVFTGRSPWPLLAVAAVVMGLNALLIRNGPWPISMVGMPGEPVSNMAPPTLVLALHTIVLACVVQAADGPLSRLLARRAVWRPVVAVNLTAMTLYLWHLPVLIGVTTLGHALGLERPVAVGPNGYPVPDGWGYALGSVVFWSVYLALVWLVVRIMWPFEYLHLPLWDKPSRLPSPPGAVAAGIAGGSTVLIGVATLVLSATGLAGFPVAVVVYAGLPLNAAAAIAALLAGGLLLRWAGAPRARAAD